MSFLCRLIHEKPQTFNDIAEQAHQSCNPHTAQIQDHYLLLHDQRSNTRCASTDIDSIQNEIFSRLIEFVAWFDGIQYHIS